MQLITNENRELRSEAIEPTESLHLSTQKKPAREGRLACGVVNKFLTIFEDFREVYLIGIQLNMK